MNPSIKNKLRQIFAKEINKDISELHGKDMELFEDWIATGLAAEHIEGIKIELDNDDWLSCIESVDNKITERDKPTKCRNCDNLVINLVNKQMFGNATLGMSIYCAYWLHKNRSGHKNSLYNVSLDDPSCTQFLSHKNVLDLHDIDISDIDVMPISSEDFITLPLASFVDKGFNIKKIDGQFFLFRDDEDKNED